MKKSIRYTLAGLGSVAIAYSVYYVRQHRQIDHEPQKSVEEILKERANQAADELKTPLGQAVLAKDWAKASSLLATLDRPHLHYANVLRGLSIQNKMSGYQNSDLDVIELQVVDLLEKEPLKDLIGYQILSTQFFRLPLLPATFKSRKRIEEVSKANEGGPYHDQAKIIALSKLIMQALPPSDQAIKQFEALQPKMTPGQWTTIVDGIRHAPTQDQMIQFIVKNWKTIGPDTQVQSLTVFSNAQNVPKNRELVSVAINALKDPKYTALIESSLRYLGALADKGGLNIDQKKKILESLSKISDQQKSPFLNEKITEIVKKLN